MNVKRMETALLTLLLLCAPGLAACGGPAEERPAESPAPAALTAAALALDGADMFTGRDMEREYDESACVFIRLEGTSASCGDASVSVSGGTVRITEEGSYLLSGSLEEGQIVVDAPKAAKVRLILRGASVRCGGSAALYVRQADKVFLTLAEGTENSLVNGGGFAGADESGIDGAVFSKEDLTVNGLGSLSVDSPAGHGIVCKDDLALTGGTLSITAASHGIQAKDSLRVAGGALTIQAGKDGVHAENDEDETLGFVYFSDGALTIDAAGDGVSAGSVLQIEGGEFDIRSGGGSGNGPEHSQDRPGGPWGRAEDTQETDASVSGKALKAGSGLTISGGSFTLDAADDAVHTNGSASVSGGSFAITTGDDGFHADETLTVSGGSIDIAASYEGLEALHLAVSGGTVHIRAEDDGLNAAGGSDGSGFGGPRGGDSFGGRGYGGMGGPGGGRGPGGGPGGEGGVPGPGTGAASQGSLAISGGELTVRAGGDGLDANGSLSISGGSILVCGPAVGDTATLDCDAGSVITGGVFIGTGGASMAQSFTESGQGVVAVLLSEQAAGTELLLTDRTGRELLSCSPELPFRVVILSSPDLAKGESYTIAAGGETFQVTAN